MKKVILTLLLGLVFVASTKANPYNNPSKDGIVITVTIEIGQPITCIIYWSICKITVGGSGLTGTAELLQTSDEKNAGGGGGGGGAGSWVVNFPRDNFSKYYPGYLSKLDGKNTVTFDATYVVPPDVAKALGTTRELVIQGNVPYPLKYENGVYTITFPY